jgi:hypothetical protein
LEQLKRLARWQPNFALATGSVSGVLVLEVDGQGQNSLLELCRDDWSWLDSLRTVAGRKRYIFFAWPEGRKQINGYLEIGQGLRVIGEGDFLLYPPSREANGVQHAFLSPQLTVVPAPVWLTDLVFEPKAGCESQCLQSPRFGEMQRLYR